MKKRLTTNWSLKILAFVIAVLLWFVVVNIDNPIQQKVYNNIPVSVINTEVLAQEQQTYQILDDTQNITVTITAQRSVLQKISASDISAIADMKELTLRTQIPIDVSVNGYKIEDAEAKPRNLQVKLEEEETKKFPIIPTTTGTVRDGYALGKIEAVPEKVSIRGPKSVIDQISRVEATVNVSGLSQDKVLASELVIYDKNNETMDQKLLTNNIGSDGVGVSVQILHTKSIPVEFNTSEVYAARGYEFTGITYEPKEVLLAGEKSVIDQIDKITIPASALKMTGVTERIEKVIDIAGYLPKNVALVDENAGSVVVIIDVEKDGTKSYDITAASIVVNNLATKLQLTYTTVDDMVIVLRGPEEVLDTYNVDTKVSIDLKKYQKPGKYVVPVQIEIPEGCVLDNEVSVTVELSEIE